MFMNEYEINEAVEMFSDDPILSKATKFLRDFRDEVNQHSDGWAYWKAPVNAAGKLMLLIKSGMAAKRGSFGTTPVLEISNKAFMWALVPIKSFMTRKGLAAGMKMPDLTDTAVQL